MSGETERWLHHAREDLENARATLTGERWSATSFHVQQAVEKALKGLWLATRHEAPPRVHDLVRLAEELGVPEDWHSELDALTRVYLLSRYPDVAADADDSVEPDRCQS